jgi:hypothetical protein
MGKNDMTRAEFVVALIVLTANVAVGHAQAQTQTTSPEPTIWDHNGSVMYLVTNGPSREFYYQKPRPGMLDAGARPGSLLFRGQVSKGQFLGTAYIFNAHCGPIPFDVEGSILDDGERIVLTGQAPRVGQNCRTHASYKSDLEFKRSKLADATQSQKPLAAAPLPAVGVSKPEVPLSNGGELPSAPKASSMKNKTQTGANSLAGLADAKVPSTPTVQSSQTDETQAAKGLDSYLWAAAFIVMIVWLLMVLFGKFLLRL